MGHGWVRASVLRARRRSCWRSGMRNTCAALMSDAVQGAPVRHAEALPLQPIFFLGLGRRPPALHRNPEVVGRRTLDRFAEDESGAVPTTNRVSPQQPQTLPAQNAAADAFLDRSSRNLKASIHRNRIAEGQKTPRRSHRALRQRL